MEASAKFARKRPVILAIPANPTLTYLSERRIDAGRSLYFSADEITLQHNPTRCHISPISLSFIPFDPFSTSSLTLKMMTFCPRFFGSYLIALCALGTPCTVSAVWDITYEELTAQLDATIEICQWIDPDVTRLNSAVFERKLNEQWRADLPRLRKSEEYQRVYADRIQELKNYSSEERLKECQSRWGKPD